MTIDEYYGQMFGESVPGLADAAAEAGQTPLDYMRDRSAFAVPTDPYEPYERAVDGSALEGCVRDSAGVYRKSGTPGAWSGELDDLAI